MAAKRIEHKADKGKAFTLDGLAAFVQDAMRSGASGSEIVGVGATWGGKIQKLNINVQIGAIADALDKS